MSNDLGELSDVEVKIIQEYRERYMKVGDFWLTPEGRAEIRECWTNPNDGNIVLPLLNELERLEKHIEATDAKIAELNEQLLRAM